MAKGNKKEEYAKYTLLISKKEKEIIMIRMKIDKGVDAINVLKADIAQLQAAIRNL